MNFTQIAYFVAKSNKNAKMLQSQTRRRPSNMTGPQLKYWRTSHDLTLRQVSDMLAGDVNHTTLSRWESLDDHIPQWAQDKLLSSTKITLPLSELQDLIDMARENNTPLQELLADCIREHLARRHQSKGKTPVRYGTSPSLIPLPRVAEAEAQESVKAVATEGAATRSDEAEKLSTQD